MSRLNPRQFREGNKQIVKFGFIGVLAVLTDLAAYWVFLQVLPDMNVVGAFGNEALAKTLSFLCGLMVTYHLNKRWTWRRKDRSDRRLVKFMLTYGFSLVMNVSINTGLLHLLHTKEWLASVPNKYFVAFAGATGFCSVFNFLMQKFWVFRVKGAP